MMASLQHDLSFRVRHVRIELTSSGFRVRRPSNEHMAQTYDYCMLNIYELRKKTTKVLYKDVGPGKDSSPRVA
jgi:hypothetical protein